MNDQQQDVTPTKGDVWPPPPALRPLPPRAASQPQRLRPVFWLGLAFNVVACLPAVRLLQYPSGSGMASDLDAMPLFYVAIVAAVAFFVGVPLAAWQIWKRRGDGLSVVWEGFGLLLCLLPAFTGCGVLFLVLKVKAFDSVA